MALASIAAREAVHVDAYSTLNDTIGMPDSDYAAFKDHAEMLEKHEYLNNFSIDTTEDIAKTCAVYGGFIEGIQLFSSFAILMNFSRFGKMKGMVKVVTWSIRDEDIHVGTCSELYQILKRENPDMDWKRIDNEVTDMCNEVVRLEDAFIDLIFDFACDKIEGMKRDEVKQYIRFIANGRMVGLGLAPIFGKVENPFKWIDWVVYGKEHQNFFEGKGTEYAIGTVSGTADDLVW
jgi:ribonucleoside-diphosphate reductase beta chain